MVLGKFLNSMTKLALSPKVTASIGVIIAVVQLSAAIESLLNSAAKKKKIGFEE